jgi:hypothetical protein
MNLTPHMETILTAVLADVRRLEAVPDRPPPGMDREEWRDLRREPAERGQFPGFSFAPEVGLIVNTANRKDQP